MEASFTALNTPVTITDVTTGRCLESTSRSVYTLPCYSNDNFQRWVITAGPYYGTVVLRDLSTNFVLDSNSAGNVYTNSPNTGNYQKWTPGAA